jgi:outer membrane immunogenic protein
MWGGVSFVRSPAVKRNVLGLVSVLALAIAAPVGAANAADMAVKAPPPPMAPVPPYFNWTGFYVGANFGGGWANDSITGSSTFTDPAITSLSSFSGNNNYSGILGGGQIGANYEFPNNWVIGIEADVDGTNLSGSTTNCATNAAGTTVGCSAVNTKINDFGTVRGRLGYALNNALFYGTGGWAWSQSSTTTNLTCTLAAGAAACPGGVGPTTGGSASASTTSTNGWAAGAGVEWAFNRNWTLRVEYLHVQFNGISESFSSTGTVPAGAFTLTSNSSTNSSNDIVRVGVNYLFH